jgi:anti-anti-sigma regulatory factor
MAVTWHRDESTTPPVFRIDGVFDETAVLNDLAAQLTGPAVLDLSNVRRMSSAGTRNWLNLIRRVKARQLVLRACSRAMVEQMNMLLDFTGGAKVESIIVPYQCPTCESTNNVLVHVAALRAQLTQGQLKRQVCPTCQIAMDLTEDADSYFLFLRYVDTAR